MEVQYPVQFCLGIVLEINIECSLTKIHTSSVCQSHIDIWISKFPFHTSANSTPYTASIPQ